MSDPDNRPFYEQIDSVARFLKQGGPRKIAMRELLDISLRMRGQESAALAEKYPEAAAWPVTLEERVKAAPKMAVLSEFWEKQPKSVDCYDDPPGSEPVRRKLRL